MTAQHFINRLFKTIQTNCIGAVAWWRIQNKRYRLRWRVLHFALAVLMLASVVIPIAQQLSQSSRYQLSADAVKLAGNTNRSLTKLLTYDAAHQQYQFNQTAISSNPNVPAALQKKSVGAPATKKTSTYALDVPQDFSKGVTYHDVNSQLSFSLIPHFSAMSGKQVSGHLVFPLSGGNQAIYTLKNNGLKEDIVLPRAQADSMTFSYDLHLPDTLQAKVIPNSNGAIGIYAADPSLFGNITYGSSADQATVQKVRVTAPKNYLVFGLPAPVIKAADGKSIGSASARFALDGQSLRVIAENLTTAKGTITIDPSVVVTSTSDFQTNGNNEGNIDFSTANSINAASLTGGSATAANWSTGGAVNVARSRAATVAYNGYIYVFGGQNSSSVAINDVQFAPLTSGVVGTWHYTHNSTDDSTSFVAGFLTARWGLTAVAYNGYMYLLGGTTNGSTYLSDVQFAPINSDGTIGTWHYTHSSTDDGTTLVSGFTTARAFMGTVVYNGYLYVYGGTTNGSASTTSVLYAQINADGTIGTWTTNGTSLTGTGRYAFAAAVYNGFIYIIGGRDASTLYATIQVAPINADASIGSWSTPSSITTARYYLGGFIYNGYMYAMGGTTNGTTGLSDVQYAPINSNGTLGTWATTTSLVATRFTPGSVAYNGYLYSIAGYNNTPQTASYYIKIDTAGMTGAYASVTPTFTTARAGQASVVYNGILYLMGGETTATNQLSDLQYATISVSGGLGSWTTQSAAIGKRSYFAAAAYNGYLYVYGGTSTGSNSLATVQYSQLSSAGVPGTFSSGGALTTGRSFVSGTVYNGYLYALGGYNAGSLSTTEYSHIGTNGVPGTWTSTTAMANARDSFTATASNGYVYVMGGFNSGTSLAYNDVYYAQLNANGTIGTGTTGTTWFTTSSFTTARENLWSLVYNGYLYVGGGSDISSNYYADVQSALINTNGTLGSFVANTSFTTGRRNASAVAANGYLYVMGGNNGSNLATTQSAAINNGGLGTVASWVTTNTVTTARSNHASVAYNGYMYVLGGYDGTNYLNDVQYAPINSNGTLGTWHYTHNSTDDSTSFVAGFTTGRRAATVTVYGGYMYIMGGLGASATYLNDVQYAPINSNGTIGTWHYTHNSTDDSTTFVSGFTTARYGHTSTAYNGYMYIMGGLGASATYLNDVKYAPINSNGTLGTWHYTHNSTDDSTSFVAGFTTARYGHTSTAYNGYLYVVGGIDSSSAMYDDVQYAPINSNGTIGTWQSTNGFNVSRFEHSMTVENGYMYILGGQDAGGTNYNDVQYAAINNNGTVGAWQNVNSNFVTARYNFATIAYNGYMYAINGIGTAGTPLSDIQYVSITSIPRTARYSKLIDFGVAVSVNSLTYTGTLPNGVSSFSASAAGTSLVSFGSPISGGAIGANAASCTQLGISNTRYLWISVTLDDFQAGAFGESGSSAATLSDFTINYTPVHAKPNIRLRLGQTLQSGNLSGLDTCGA